MKITMPVTSSAVQACDMARCTFYLATEKSTGKQVTLLRCDKEVMVFMNNSSPCFISPNYRSGFDSDWVNTYYDIIREYGDSDTFSITV
jgi:hypothetical protein